MVTYVIALLHKQGERSDEGDPFDAALKHEIGLLR
jgi:hypothetical protein